MLEATGMLEVIIMLEATFMLEDSCMLEATYMLGAMYMLEASRYDTVFKSSTSYLVVMIM